MARERHHARCGVPGGNRHRRHAPLRDGAAGQSAGRRGRDRRLEPVIVGRAGRVQRDAHLVVVHRADDVADFDLVEALDRLRDVECGDVSASPRMVIVRALSRRPAPFRAA